MTQARRRATFGMAAVVAVLIALHLRPPHGGPEPLLGGVLPWDLTWHVLWMVAAMLAVLAMTSRRLWPDDEDPRDE